MRPHTTAASKDNFQLTFQLDNRVIYVTAATAKELRRPDANDVIFYNKLSADKLVMIREEVLMDVLRHDLNILWRGVLLARCKFHLDRAYTL